MKFWTFLVQPQIFFRGLYEYPTSLRWPLGIVLGAGWFRYIAFLIWIRNLPPILPTELFSAMSMKTGGHPYWIGVGLLGLLCWPLISWGIYGWLIQLLARCRGRAWQLAGWTYLPIAIVGLVMIGIAGIWPATGRVIPYTQVLALRPEETLINQYQTWLQIYGQILRGQAFMKILSGAILGASLWSLGLLYWGVKTIAPAKAVLTTSLLTIWVLIWRVL